MNELYIEVVQLQYHKYFWVLRCTQKFYASSSTISTEKTVTTEALEVAKTLGLQVVTNQRQSLNLDFDQDLATDAVSFGLGTQGVGDVAVAPREHFKAPMATTSEGRLKEALQLVKQIYGETNSGCSRLFMDWIEGLELGRDELGESTALLKMLVIERSRYCARVGRAKEMEDADETWLSARLNAVVAACNLIRAVQAQRAGRDYDAWLEKVFWRITNAIGDRREKR